MKASSESGECASLISTGSLSVFEAVCGAGMGLFVSFSGATRAGPDHFTCNREAAASPWLALSQRDFPTGERVFRRRTEETCASQGLAWRWAGRFLAGESLAYWCPANNWEPRGRCVLDNEGQHRKRENAEQEGDSFLLKRYNARSLPSVCGLILRPSAFRRRGWTPK